MKLELRKTADGSNTLYVPDLDEHYHSFHGAFQEATHVFIKNGLLNQDKKELRILEVGFGTGLNALLSARESVRFGYTIDYVGIEAYPVSSELMAKMDYATLFEDSNAALFFEEIIHSKWSKPSLIHPKFQLTKIEERIEETFCEGCGEKIENLSKIESV